MLTCSILPLLPLFQMLSMMLANLVASAETVTWRNFNVLDFP